MLGNSISRLDDLNVVPPLLAAADKMTIGGELKHSEQRYSAVNRAFHWLTALLILTVVILGWLMAVGEKVPKNLPFWEWHKTVGLFVLFITTCRLGWRLIDPPPPTPVERPLWDDRLAKVTYIVFFLPCCGCQLRGI